MEEVYSLQGFKQEDFERYLLVADIGGENSFFAVMGVVNRKEFVLIMKYSEKTRNVKVVHNYLNKVLEEAHKRYNISISRTVIAGSGVVSRYRHKLKLVGHDLEICSETIRNNTLLLKVILINSFEAEGFGLDFLSKDKIKRISNVDIINKLRTSAIIGAAHSLSASIIHYDNIKHLKVPISSQAGHVSFAPMNFFDLEFLTFVRERLFEGEEVVVGYEFFASGKALPIIYDFLVQKKYYGEPKIDVSNSSDKTLKIFENRHDAYCKRAVELFVIFYARASKDLALICEPYSGLFLSGKVALAAEDEIRALFMDEFLKHPFHEAFLRKIPVFLVDDENIALLGACNVAVNFYNFIC